MDAAATMQEFAPWWASQPVEIRAKCSVEVMTEGKISMSPHAERKIVVAGKTYATYDYDWADGHVSIVCPDGMKTFPAGR